MSDNEFKISRVNETIIIEKGEQVLRISQAVDNDVWFTASGEELSLQLNMHSINYSEFETYMVFEYFLKLIIGRYMLNGDNKKEYSILPKDFIDLDSKTIICHSDSGNDNILKFVYDERTIEISLSKSKTANSHCTNAVRIRTNGSSYENYYQEFIEFFRRLSELEYKLNKSMYGTENESKKNVMQKTLSLFKIREKK